MTYLKKVMDEFFQASGLKVNLSKSHLLGINLEDGEIKELAEVLGCSVGVWPMLYLGLPLGGNPRSRSFWEPVIRRVSKRLDGWNKAFFFLKEVG